MNTTTLARSSSLVVLLAIAALGSSGARAGQAYGRDSVYVSPSVTLPAAKVTWTPPVRQGRGSVYAFELPAPTPKGTVQAAAGTRFGRS